MSHAAAFVDAGEEIRYESRRRLATVALPGSGDFYVFDDEAALFLHYAGNGTNTAFEGTDDPTTVQACVQAFSTVWSIATPVAQARRELGARLRQLRKAAGLTGQAVAEATGQHFTRISRVENGGQLPTERNISDWCAACGAEEQVPDLLATARAVESAYLEWSRQSRAGVRRLGDLHSPATYRRTTTFKIHEPTVMPGIFQTEAYIRRMLSFWHAFLDAPDDPDDADATVAMKADRTAIALHPSKRIAAVLGEQALRTRRGTPQEHSDQLNHLLSLMRLPFVSVGIIPANAQRHAIASIGFWIFDHNAVALETPTAAIKVTRPNEIALYATLFDQLHAEAVYGARARQLITEVLSDL